MSRTQDSGVIGGNVSGKPLGMHGALHAIKLHIVQTEQRATGTLQDLIHSQQSLYTEQGRMRTSLRSQAPTPKRALKSPSIQYSKFLIPIAIVSMVFGTRNLNYWMLGPFGGCCNIM